jgi:hypothetical protein
MEFNNREFDLGTFFIAYYSINILVKKFTEYSNIGVCQKRYTGYTGYRLHRKIYVIK